MSGSTSDDREMGSARQAGAELRKTQASTVQRLDELPSQNEVHNELVSVQNDLVTQMQSMTAMMCRLVNSVILGPHPPNIPRRETAQQPRQLFDNNQAGNDGNWHSYESTRHGAKTSATRRSCFERGQTCHFAKEFPRNTSNHLSYRGPGQ